MPNDFRIRTIKVIKFNYDVLVDITEYEFEVLNNVISANVDFGNNEDTLVTRDSMVKYVEQAIEKVKAKYKNVDALNGILKDVRKVNKKVYFALGC